MSTCAGRMVPNQKVVRLRLDNAPLQGFHWCLFRGRGKKRAALLMADELSGWRYEPEGMII